MLISLTEGPEPLVCSARCLASALDGAGIASLGLYWGDKGEVCLPQRQSGTQGVCWLAPQAKFTLLTRAKLAALEVMVPGCLAHCCSQLPCLAVNSGPAFSVFFFSSVCVRASDLSLNCCVKDDQCDESRWDLITGQKIFDAPTCRLSISYDSERCLIFSMERFILLPSQTSI